MSVHQQNEAILFTGNGQKLSYSGLKAWDANGKPLVATIEVHHQKISLVAATQDAALPITIDPIIANGNPANVDAILESNQASALLGQSVSAAGDVNDDGFSDVVIGASGYDNGQTNEGAAFVYQGSTNGLSATATILECNQGGAELGISVSAAGDVNGDGFGDVVIGAIGYDNGQLNEGAAFVYHGSASGISTSVAAMVESNQTNSNFGRSVSGAGDVNNDGFDDVIVGALYYDNNGLMDNGAAFLYKGSANGISNATVTTIESDQAFAYLGVSASGTGDVNGDVYSDIIVGADGYNNGQNDEGVAFVYHGSASGINTTPAAILEKNQGAASLGGSVSAAGDVNGDGFDDVVVGAPYYNNGQIQEGAAFVYHGSTSGINTTAVAMLESNQVNAQAGYSVSAAGDINGDGFGDVIVGATDYDNGQTDEGAAFVYLGSAGNISSTAIARIESNQAGAYLGHSVSGAGDVNGDDTVM